MHNHKLVWLDGVAQPEGPGRCRGCDVDFYIPKNLHAVLADGNEIPLEASYVERDDGRHEWTVVVPETEVRIEGFEADNGLQDGHLLSFVGAGWVREQERRRAMTEAGPESGPLPEGEQVDE